MLKENIEVLKTWEGNPPQFYAYPNVGSALYNQCIKNNVSYLNRGYRSISGWGTYYAEPWTIGYGHANGVKEGDYINQKQADKFLADDIKSHEISVQRILLKFAAVFTQNEIDAFVIFHFSFKNADTYTENLIRSIVNNRTRTNIENTWRQYIFSGGQPIKGLLNRRNAELEVYFKDTPSVLIDQTEQDREQQKEQTRQDNVRAIQYTVYDTISIDKFLKNTKSLIPNVNKQDFLKFKPKDRTNADQIFSKYSQEEQNNQSIKDKYSKFDLDEIKQNTTIYLPVSELQEQLYLIGGKNVFIEGNQSLPAYLVDEQVKLLQDPKYVKLEKIYSQGDIDIQTIEENCQVWIYVKSIDKLLDISSFVLSLTTSKTDIGQFSIELTPIQIEVNRESNDIEAIFISSTNGREYLNNFEIKRVDGLLNVSFFEKYCQQNDAVFIRFEKLQLEEDINVTKFGSHQIEVSKQSIPDQIFDMIGLVDSVSSGVNFESTDYSISISGRDYTKALVEDGSYLMDLTFAKGSENMFFYLGDSQDKSFKRNFVSNGAFEYLFKEFHDPINTYMGFIVNQLSNIGWTGDNDLFNYYPKDKLAQKNKIGISNEQFYLDNIEQNGIWKISHIKVDPKLNDRRVVDAAFIDEDGTLYEQFKKVCQSPFVEFWGDTYSSQFNYIARQQPFDLDGMDDVLNTDKLVIDVETADTFQMNLQWEDEFYSWIQFYPHNLAFSNDIYWLAAAFPIVYFDKYVEHFGNHRYQVYDNYVSGRAVDTSDGKEAKENIAYGLFRDLKYVIETISVLPFTRKGTIVINGDRRIKKGSFVYLKATKEVFYVEGVSNSVSFSNNSINRTTVLSVKRGMKKDWILAGKGETPDKKFKSKFFISYFNIVNSDMIVNQLIDRFNYVEGLKKSNIVTTTQQVKVDFGVNEDVFNFFLQRRQMDII